MKLLGAGTALAVGGAEGLDAFGAFEFGDVRPGAVTAAGDVIGGLIGGVGFAELGRDRGFEALGAYDGRVVGDVGVTENVVVYIQNGQFGDTAAALFHARCIAPRALKTAWILECVEGLDFRQIESITRTAVTETIQFV